MADIAKKPRDGKKGNRSPRSSWRQAVRRLDALFEIERAINGRSAHERYAVRQEKSKPLLDDMYAWLLRERDTLSRSSEVLKPINLHARALGRLRPLHRRRQNLPQQQRGRKSAAWHCFGKAQLDLRRFPARANRAAVMLTLITTCRLNDVDPKAWFADVLARITDLPVSRLHELLPWKWNAPKGTAIAAAA